MLFTPVFADYMEAYGKGGLKAEGLGALKWLARLYWYTVEFGLIRTNDGLRNYGAGILSSPGEINYAVRSPEPRRVAFDLKRIMRSLYRIDAFQETYFVIDSFDQLFEATAPDFTPLYRELRTLDDVPANALLPEDRLVG
jgi:phenylalanine-4-hydroxylase